MIINQNEKLQNKKIISNITIILIITNLCKLRAASCSKYFKSCDLYSGSSFIVSKVINGSVRDSDKSQTCNFASAVIAANIRELPINREARYK